MVLNIFRLRQNDNKLMVKLIQPALVLNSVNKIRILDEINGTLLKVILYSNLSYVFVNIRHVLSHQKLVVKPVISWSSQMWDSGLHLRKYIVTKFSFYSHK